jgi:chemotaxis protein MotB
LPAANVSAVAGRADAGPLFPDDPYIAANRRVTIALMCEAPPVPTDFKPCTASGGQNRVPALRPSRK